VTTKTSFRSIAILLSLTLPIALMPSCARDQQLTAITVQPNNVTFEGVGAAVQMTALGTYEHPFATKDITNIVQWSVDVKNLATVTNGGLVTAINVCGSGNVIARYEHPPGTPSGSVAIGTAAIAGSGQGTTTCNSATLTVGILGQNTSKGSVTSSPAGITCPSVCSAVFSLGAQVVLTATTAGFGGWQGCDSFGTTSNVCIVTLNGSRNPTVTFN
jgi:Big-like domain-containing protein